MDKYQLLEYMSTKGDEIDKLNEVTVGNYVYYPVPIGRGSFARVYKGYHRWTKHEVAVKKFLLDEAVQGLSGIQFLQRVQNEIKMMLHFSHPNIIKLYDYMFSKDGRVIFIVMEYCSGGDMHHYLKRHGPLSEEKTKRYFTQIACGLKYLLSKKILHRDLKPHNFLIGGDGIIKITDFSFAKLFEKDTMSSTVCGSPLYMAPELLRGELYTNKSDLYSLGVVLYRMLFDRYPYVADTPYALVEKIQNDPLIIPTDQFPISPQCVSLLTSLLQKNITTRIGWLKFFNHKWFIDQNNEDLMYSIKLDQTIYDMKDDLENDYCIIDEFDPIILPSENNEKPNSIVNYILSFIY